MTPETGLLEQKKARSSIIIREVAIVATVIIFVLVVGGFGYYYRETLFGTEIVEKGKVSSTQTSASTFPETNLSTSDSSKLMKEISTECDLSSLGSIPSIIDNIELIDKYKDAQLTSGSSSPKPVPKPCTNSEILNNSGLKEKQEVSDTLTTVTSSPKSDPKSDPKPVSKRVINPESLRQRRSSLKSPSNDDDKKSLPPPARPETLADMLKINMDRFRVPIAGSDDSSTSSEWN